MKDLLEMVEEAEKQIGKPLKGCIILKACGVCFTECEPMPNLLAAPNPIEAFIDFVEHSRYYVNHGVIIPATLEKAKKLDFRIVFYPICRDCMTLLERDTDGTLNIVFRNVLNLRNNPLASSISIVCGENRKNEV